MIIPNLFAISLSLAVSNSSDSSDILAGPKLFFKIKKLAKALVSTHVKARRISQSDKIVSYLLPNLDLHRLFCLDLK